MFLSFEKGKVGENGRLFSAGTSVAGSPFLKRKDFERAIR